MTQGTNVTVTCNSMDYEQLFNGNPYNKTVRIRNKYLLLLKAHKTKTAAAYLDEVIEEYFKPNLFKKKK